MLEKLFGSSASESTSHMACSNETPSTSTAVSPAGLHHFQAADTAWLRVQQIFLKNEYGFHGLEFDICRWVGCTSGLLGVLLGGLGSVHQSQERFKLKTTNTRFVNMTEAVTRHTDFVMARMFLRGVSVGARLAAISTLPALLTACLCASENTMTAAHLFTGTWIGCSVLTLHRGPVFMTAMSCMFATCLGSMALWPKTALNLYSNGNIMFSTAFVSVPVSYLCRTNSCSAEQLYMTVREEHFQWRLAEVRKDNDLHRIMSEHKLWTRFSAERIYKRQMNSQLVTDETEKSS